MSGGIPIKEQCQTIFAEAVRYLEWDFSRGVDVKLPRFADAGMIRRAEQGTNARELAVYRQLITVMEGPRGSVLVRRPTLHLKAWEGHALAHLWTEFDHHYLLHGVLWRPASPLSIVQWRAHTAGCYRASLVLFQEVPPTRISLRYADSEGGKARIVRSYGYSNRGQFRWIGAGEEIRAQLLFEASKRGNRPCWASLLADISLERPSLVVEPPKNPAAVAKVGWDFVGALREFLKLRVAALSGTTEVALVEGLETLFRGAGRAAGVLLPIVGAGVLAAGIGLSKERYELVS